MTNVVRQKSLECFEWTLQVPFIHSLHPVHHPLTVSESFTFHNRKCNLYSYITFLKPFSPIVRIHIGFKCDGNMDHEIEVIVIVTSNSRVYSISRKRITEGKQEIWKDETGDLQTGTLLTVELISLSNTCTGDKSIQTPSYIDTRFLLESASHDFSKMFDEAPNHDVEFTCGDQTIKAHKSILCSRSNVFASMFHSDMVEGKTGRVEIQDMDASIFKQFLKSLYTGMLTELTVDTAVQFYKASDKYAIDTLRKQCADFLTDNLSRENACEILVLADMHIDSELKKGVMEYILKEKISFMGETYTEKNWVLKAE